MKVDLTKIFNQQRELDKEIHTKHNVSYRTINRELKLALLVELGELANEIRSFKFWSLKKPSSKETILEEYVDGIHFITSICIRYIVSPKFEVKRYLNKYQNPKEITKAFVWLFRKTCNINTAWKARYWYMNYLKFGFRLGFSMEDIIKAYEKKNKVNHDRQKNNY
ncbi:MAG: dUTP diphosphatase [Mycoplasma sp.]|nr:dUTP diphosphatase [Candidatus Hennigella equi]